MGQRLFFIIFKMAVIWKDMNIQIWRSFYKWTINIYQTSSYFFAKFVVLFVCWDVNLQLK